MTLLDTTFMHVLCFDCALELAQSAKLTTKVVPAFVGDICPVCGGANPFDLEGLEFRPTVPGLGHTVDATR